LILLFCCFTFYKTANADVEINYQAKLTDSEGSVVEDGSYHMKFKIWGTQNVDNILWSEILTGSNRVKIENGIFQVKLGQINPINFNFDDDNYYLSIVVGGKEEQPNWDLGISLIKKIKLADLKFKMQTLGMDIFEKISDINQNAEIEKNKTIEEQNENKPMTQEDLMGGIEGPWIFQGNALTDSLMQALSAPENSLDFFDSNGDISLTTAPDKNFKIILGSASSSVNILTGNLKIGSKDTEVLPGFELKGESIFVSGNLGVAGKTYLGGELFLHGQNIATKMNIVDSEVETGYVVVSFDDNDLNKNSTTTQAKISYKPNDTNILGVISENSGILLNHSEDNSRPVVLSGVVKIKVSNENGIIQTGDLLTTSSDKGYAMKAILPGVGIVAKALENFEQEQGIINAVLQLGTYYTTVDQILTVAKKGGNFTTISSAINSIQDASPELPYLIKVAPGIYEENIIMKEYVDIVGAGPSLVKITSVELPLIKMASNSRLENVTAQLSIAPVKDSGASNDQLSINKDLTGIVEIDEGIENIEINLVKILAEESGIRNEELEEEFIIHDSLFIIPIYGILVKASSSVEIYNVDIQNVDVGVAKIGAGTVEIKYSTIKANKSDIQTIINYQLSITNDEEIKNEEVEDDEVKNCKLSIGNCKLTIESSYNFLLGAGYNFNIATGTAISSFADKYETINKQGVFTVLDYVKNSEDSAITIKQEGKGNILNLQNIDSDVFTVDSLGVIKINSQNATGTSFNLFAQSDDIGMQISQQGSGSAARFVGEVIISPKQDEETARLTFDSNSVISSQGNTMSIGDAGDTVNLNVQDVKYEFSEKVRRNTIFLFVDKPRQNQYLLGNKDNSWQPEEDIILLKLKLQYSVADTQISSSDNTVVDPASNNALRVVLHDNTEYPIIDTELIFQYNPGYYQIITDISNEENAVQISSDQGIYLEITHAQGVEQLSIEIEYLYQ
ncbi:hypothetical protein KKC56_01650, partial [Patescibacteria group bacterium]|nr:hypothetical protein [Patescibacteria group bacterium]